MHEPDSRYRLLILLQRADRPRYFEFYCVRCQYRVAELANTEVLAAQDLIDTTTTNIAGVGVRCDGRYRGDKCGTYYFFVLSESVGRTIKPIATRASIHIAVQPQ